MHTVTQRIVAEVVQDFPKHRVGKNGKTRCRLLKCNPSQIKVRFHIRKDGCDLLPDRGSSPKRLILLGKVDVVPDGVCRGFCLVKESDQFGVTQGSPEQVEIPDHPGEFVLDVVAGDTREDAQFMVGIRERFCCLYPVGNIVGIDPEGILPRGRGDRFVKRSFLEVHYAIDPHRLRRIECFYHFIEVCRQERSRVIRQPER